MVPRPESDTVLDGRCALVTGGSVGIGAAIALRLARHGADVAVTYRSHRSEAEAVVESIRRSGRRAVALHADLARTAAAGELVDQCQDALGDIDVLVANAGVGEARRWEEVDLDLWQQTMTVNLTSPFLLAQAVLPQMISRRYGRLLFVSSIAALTGGAIVGPHYAASKAGLHGLTYHLSGWGAPHGVTVNAIAPMLVDRTGLIPPDFDREQAARQVPVGRLGLPDDVAQLAVAMVLNSYLTNKVITLDGGLLAR
jgi:3-oxoacyl-[acyl-carrier protein] reductase